MRKKTYNLQLTTYGSSRGFTLIEAVVATSVFAIAITSMVGVYVAIQRLNQASAALQALQQNARFITEDITKIVRNGQVDYARYVSTYGISGVPQPLASPSRLFLIDQDGVSIEISQSGDDLRIEKTGIGATNYSGREVKVLDFKAYVWPALNPFAVGATVREQPTVTIYLNLESNINPRDKTRFPMQITVATRRYPE